MMKYVRYTALIFLTSLTFSVSFSATKVQQPPAIEPLGLSDEDIKKMGLNDQEAGEVRQIFDVFNKMSPEEKAQIEELGKKTEDAMRTQKLDPNNFDDMMKFMESEGMMQPGAAPKPVEPQIKRPEPRPQPIPQPRQVQQPSQQPIVAAPVVKPSDLKTKLGDIIKHVGSFKQKAATWKPLQRKLESINLQFLNEFVYHANILKADDLLTLLSTQEFTKLRSNLERLHKGLMTYEPSMTARKEPEESPYDTLGISINATEKQIKGAFAKAKQTLDPRVVQAELEKQGLDEKAIKKAVKSARLGFSFYEAAYDILMDKEQRTELNTILKEQRGREAHQQKTTQRAFNKLNEAFTDAFFSHGLLKDIRSLLEKHKPQEFAKAQKQLAAEKKARDRLPVKVQIMAPRIQPAQTFDQFYQQMARESFARRPVPRPGAPTAGMRKPVQAPGAKKPSPAKKDDKKKDKDKKAKDKKAKDKAKEKDKKAKDKDVPLTKKEQQKAQEQFADMRDLERLLETAHKKLEAGTFTYTPIKK